MVSVHIHAMVQTYSIQAHMCLFSGFCSFSESEHPCILFTKMNANFYGNMQPHAMFPFTIQSNSVVMHQYSCVCFSHSVAIRTVHVHAMDVEVGKMPTYYL